MNVLTDQILTTFKRNICSADDFKRLLALHPNQIHTVGMVSGHFRIDYETYHEIVDLLLCTEPLKLSNVITRLPQDIVKDVIYRCDFDLLGKVFEHLMDQYQYNTSFSDVYRYNDVLCQLGNRLLVLKFLGYDTEDMLCGLAYYTNIKDYCGKGRSLYNNVMSITQYERWINYRKLTNSL